MTPDQVIIEANQVSAYLVAFMTALVGFGFFRLLLISTGVVRYLTLGFLLLYLKVFARATYWDVLPNWIGADTWERWYQASSGRAMNTIFNIVVIVASYYSLKAIHSSIPRAARGNYNLLTSVFYPPGGLSGAVAHAFRRVFRRG
ncbi:hypothetical protein [Roseitranquillus sediminis]|uniref:hypothetical protein n=1 Tax=Roseitranquillus sediminis TaxID=2809051 RepID=UPI001D0C8E49|nr:hypothetical protein [Roseitranquillus sediminis]MBM9594297.1 hypothetical protein [Roseitranquillus sediminis]